MTTLDILKISSLIILCGLILWNLHLPQALLTKWKASSIGLNLNFVQARFIAFSRCNEIDFLLCLRDIWSITNIPIVELVVHYGANGDLFNLRDGIVEMNKKNKKIDLGILTSLDLAGRNLVEEIKKAELNNWDFGLASG